MGGWIEGNLDRLSIWSHWDDSDAGQLNPPVPPQPAKCHWRLWQNLEKKYQGPITNSICFCS